MGKFNKACCLFLFIFINISSNAQESRNIIDHQYYYEQGERYYDDGLFGIALNQFELYPFEDDAINHQALASFELNENRSIDLLLESISRGVSEEIKNQTYSNIGNRFFTNKNYKESRKYFEKVDLVQMPKSVQNDLNFKIAYTYLTEKNFTSAFPYFTSVSQTNNQYKTSALYYKGICAYYLNDKEEALDAFSKVKDNPKYRSIVPFYLAQIYFKDEDYDNAIKYAESLKSQSTNQNLVDRILGLSYLAKDEYKTALPYLESYADNTPKLTENEFYQLGILNYRLGNLENSKKYLRELNHQNTELGQLSNFLLGSIYLNENDKKSAQAAFKQSSKENYYSDIREESQYLYYKISAELGEERIAINGLSSMIKENPYYNEAQELLSELVLRIEDRSAAIDIIENLEFKESQINDSYKSLTKDYSLQLIADESYEESITYIDKSIEAGNTEDHELIYWKAYAQNEMGNIEQSQKNLTTYIKSNHSDHKFEAHYLKAYQEMESKSYNQSLESLSSAINSFDVNSDDKSLLDDAIVRLADLELVRNNYDSAIEYYDLAIQNNAEESDYILYQKALVYGVKGQDYDKLTTLEELIKKYPTSNYRDDAFFAIGETLIALDKNNEAYQIFSSVIIEYGQKSEYTALAHMRKGLISYNQGDLYAALDAYKQGIKLTQDKDEKRRALITVEEIYLNELNDPDAYFKFTEEETGYAVNDISKDSITYHVALNTYKDQLYERAISQFDSYTAKYPKGFYRSDAFYYTAESYVILKNYNNALVNYENVLTSKTSQFYEPSLKKAALIAFNNNQDFEKAYAYYNELIESTNELNLEYIESALYSAFKMSNTNGIMTYGKIITESEKADNKSKSNAYFYMAKTALTNGNQQEAISSLQEVVKLSDNSKAAEASYLIAKLYFESGRIDDAESKAFETTKLAAKYPVWVARSLILLGDIYKEKKDYLNSSAAYESVIENFKDNIELVESTKEKLRLLNELIESESRILKEGEEFETQQDSIR